MTSLTTHLRQPESHGRLTFHPDCPICRQARLTGALSTERLVSLRAQAALTAGMLAISAAAPATSALAAEQDQEQSGTAPVAQTDTEQVVNPDFDPGGGSTSLPDTGPPVALSPANGNDATGPVEPEPATNPADPIVDTGDGSDTAAEPAPPAAASPPAPTSTGEAPQPTAPPSPEVPAGPAPTSPPASEAPAPDVVEPRDTQVDQSDDEPRQDRAKPARRDSTGPQLPSTTTAPAPNLVSAAPRVAPATSAVGEGAPAKPGDRAHTVRPGESLWAIAADVLGADATPAQIAREVHRLWVLNGERIGTGDPDLLMIGTRITLR